MHQGPPATSLGTAFTHRNHLLPGMYQFEACKSAVKRGSWGGDTSSNEAEI